MISEQVYVIVFDHLDPSYDPVAMRDAVRGDGRISHYWNHIPNCFLVTTDRNAHDLRTLIKKHAGEVGFLVMEAEPANSDGHLPNRSWEWIRQREQERSAEVA